MAYKTVTLTMSASDSVRRAIPDDAVVSVWRAPDRWPLRTFDWASAAAHPRGSILFLGGRGDIIEKYLEAFAHWHAHGWQVSAFDWRGQGGSGRLSANPRVGHVDDFAVWIDDLDTYVANWMPTTPPPHIVMGHSMGGHLVLRALIEHRIAPSAAVLVAPMLGFDTAPLTRAFATRLAARLAARLGPDRPAWPANEKPSAPWVKRQSYLTHDDGRYADELWWRDERPDLVLGPPSWPWLAAAYRSFDLVEAPGAPEAVATPVLMLATLGDRLVSPKAIERIAARLPHVRLRMFNKDVAHEILRERDGPRTGALKEIDAFLDAVTPAG
jgi:lysophospholipase